ncbi:GMC family oxidoreductase N-terminal domain-containing protein [Patulibacter sp. SYSU D01012]|uniref:GMC family oxidoreductase n=1 Tax=Patulibacter sp. SYSU D01012 TaxID=2817381 RepID=UPI001B3101DD|nr:GMC family oxidoreductase N-terminal domain-containing protein [Patulibacter sp. SYSU D01012]
MLPPDADYVIVGAGSAGCVLANRLTEDPGTTVLLLEAGGPDRSLNVRIPLAFPKQFHTKLDWDFATDPEPGCANRRLFVPRGKQLGGSSSMNAMLYVRGRPLDYDLWEQEDAAGWGWDAVRPYFLKAETNGRAGSEDHGYDGPLHVRDQRSPRPISRDLLAGFEAAGVPRIADYNGPEQDGTSWFQVLQKDGRRWSAADAYLRPAMDRPNLRVMTHAHVQRLELDGRRATGVVVRERGGHERTVRAGREVLLAAGAIGSPQLLMLSGVGPGAHLQARGVPVAHDLPGVGRNLQDHPMLTVLFEVSEPTTLYGADRPKPLLEWLLRRSGPLTSCAAETVAFWRSRPGLPAADIQFHNGPLYFERHGEESFDGHAICIAPVLVAPRSRGRVELTSASAGDAPSILTNSLTEREDVDAMVAGMKMARRVAATGPLAGKVVRELKPGPDAETEQELEDALRERVELIYHPVGTCRIGADAASGAVVDPDLRVHGIEGLRVIDASVFPLIPGGNTHAPTVMVAERAADLIRGRAATPGAAPTAGVAA